MTRYGFQSWSRRATACRLLLLPIEQVDANREASNEKEPATQTTRRYAGGRRWSRSFGHGEEPNGALGVVMPIKPSVVRDRRLVGTAKIEVKLIMSHQFYIKKSRSGISPSTTMAWTDWALPDGACHFPNDLPAFARSIRRTYQPP